MSINKIAGQTLQSTLLRDGVNLAVQNIANSTPVLYIDIANSRIGINKTSASVALEVVGNVQANNASFTGNLTPTANITYTLGNATNQWANVYANNFIGSVTGNITGNITAPGSNTQVIFNDAGVLGASAGITFTKTSNLLTVTGNISSGNVLTAGLVSATANITGGNILTSGLISAAGTITGTSHLGSVVSVTANITGGNVLTGGLVSATGNIISASNVAGGNIISTVLTTATANANITITPTGTGLGVINTTTGLLLPVGNTAQRPSPGTAGTVRFNTTTTLVEVYDGSTWDSVQGAAITDQIIVSDGISTAYTLNKSTTAAAIIVSINGLVQIPGASYAYTVSGNTITFTNAPTISDIIDIRFLQ